MFHTLILVGNVGRDPEMRYTPSGHPVTQFSVACNRKYTSSNGEQVSETVWFRVAAWGKMGEACNQYLRKGSRVLVEGRLNPDRKSGGPRVWNKNDGTPGASYEVNAQIVRFLTPRDDGSFHEAAVDEGSQETPFNEPEPQVGPADDDMPF